MTVRAAARCRSTIVRGAVAMEIGAKLAAFGSVAGTGVLGLMLRFPALANHVAENVAYRPASRFVVAALPVAIYGWIVGVLLLYVAPRIRAGRRSWSSARTADLDAETLLVTELCGLYYYSRGDIEQIGARIVAFAANLSDVTAVTLNSTEQRILLRIIRLYCPQRSSPRSAQSRGTVDCAKVAPGLVAALFHVARLACARDAEPLAKRVVLSREVSGEVRAQAAELLATLHRNRL